MQNPPRSLLQWFETPLGRYLLEREFAYLDGVVADLFGFNAIQIGLVEFDFLRASRIPLRCRVGASGPVQLHCDPEFLPIAANSVDLCLLPHALEFASNPHQILREVQRVLMPEGHLIVAGFNPWSLWGIRRTLKRGEAHFPWCGRFINLPRLKDWLALLGFEVAGGRMSCYAPPFSREQWLGRFRFMEAAGDRWWPIGGGVYFVDAVKRVPGVRVITPKWNGRVTANERLAAASQQVARGRLRIVAKEQE
jgi:SAM-dependent methyltransferase